MFSEWQAYKIQPSPKGALTSSSRPEEALRAHVLVYMCIYVSATHWPAWSLTLPLDPGSPTLVCNPLCNQRHNTGSLRHDHRKPINLHWCPKLSGKLCISHSPNICNVGSSTRTLSDQFFCPPYFSIVQHFFRPVILPSSTLFTVRGRVACFLTCNWEWKKQNIESLPESEDNDKRSFLLHTFHKSISL